MKPLEPPDNFHLRAAVGWLELGNPKEARAELDGITRELQGRPDVLEVRWQVEAATQQWERCRDVAHALMQALPTSPTAWIFQAYALRRVPGGGLRLAWDALLPAVEKFPKEPIIRYNLACYACQLGDLEQAWKWLGRALAIGDAPQLKAMAAQDEDLKPLWPRLEAG